MNGVCYLCFYIIGERWCLSVCERWRQRYHQCCTCHWTNTPWTGNTGTHTDGHHHTVHCMFNIQSVSQCLCLQEDLWGQAWRVADGVIQCRFQRNILLPRLENRFSFNHSYFLFLAHGRSQQGKTAFMCWCTIFLVPLAEWQKRILARHQYQYQWDQVEWTEK